MTEKQFNLPILKKRGLTKGEKMTLTETFGLIFLICMIINFLMVISMIFLEKRKPQSIMAWLFIFTVLPLIGFFFYILLGGGLSLRVRKMIKQKTISKKQLIASFDFKNSIDEIAENQEIQNNRQLVSYCFEKGFIPCVYNQVKIFNSGLEKIDALKKDLLSAKKTINMEYYIFADDKTGREIFEILIKKAQEGVKVKFMYDSVGCKKTSRRYFSRLKKVGGEVAEFFPPFLKIRLINLKLNYRNHRKIVVIDGKIAYTGGVNIRNDHMGLNKKLSPWRDTHLRIVGNGAFALQSIFLCDWRYAYKKDHEKDLTLNNEYFSKFEKKGNVALQVLSSGPNSNQQEIKEAYVKMITNAKKRVYIQTPYFVPDDVFYTALRIAKESGVDVRLMIPKKPDKKVVYLPTISYSKEMTKMGIKVFLYEGFIHSKTLLIDDDILSIGTCNIDNRSFGLNFEDTVVMYSKQKNKEYANQFESDMKNSVEADDEYYKKNHRFLSKMGEAFFRLLSPIL